MLPHQVLVHFPIALLTIYALLELARFPAVTKSAWWFPVKAAFVLLGSASSVATVLSGLLLVGNATDVLPKIVIVHRNMAFLTLIIFAILALAHLVIIAQHSKHWAKMPQGIAEKKLRAAKFVLQPWVCVPLAIAGLLAVTATGALGGAMSFGPDIDPVSRFMYDLFID